VIDRSVPHGSHGGVEGTNGLYSTRKLVVVLGSLSVLLAGALVLSLSAGGAASPEWIRALFSGGLTPAQENLLRLRLTRVLMGAVCGGALGACGAVLQALLRNPLAYPHILGISGGAAVGGIAAELFGFSSPLLLGVHLPGAPLAAFLAALATTFLVYRAASLGGRIEPVSLILVGVVANSFAAALILFFFAVTDRREARGVLYWMVGSLDGISLSQAAWAAPLALAGLVFLYRVTPALNLLSQDEEVAASLGVRVPAVRAAAFVGTSVVVGAVVSVCGMIGFVGLIVPHLLRLLLGPDNRLLYPASFLGGATFLVLADFLARNLLYPKVIPVGVFTAFCGGPFFLFLLRRYHERRVF